MCQILQVSLILKSDEGRDQNGELPWYTHDTQSPSCGTVGRCQNKIKTCTLYKETVWQMPFFYNLQCTLK